MKLSNMITRVRAWAGLSRLLGVRGGTQTLHLCELHKSVCCAGLPTIDVKGILDRIRPDRNGEPSRIIMHPTGLSSGSGSMAEMACICAIVAVKKPKTILEFGTFDGCSAWHMLANAPSDTNLITLDLPSNTKTAGSTDFGLQGVASRPFLPDSPRVNLIEIDSREWVPKVEGGADLCFIDAGHSYECVKNDTEKALAVTNKGGVILWHDTTWRRDDYGVNSYMKELLAKGQDVRLISVGPVDYSGLAVMIV
jgi:predicted O-methyltransferase YrrM